MKRAIILVTAVLATAAPSMSHACTPPSQDAAKEAQTRDIASFVSIYEAQVTNVAPGPYDHSWNFSLHPTRNVWGETPPRETPLTFEPGACTNWFFIMDEDAGDRPHDGMKVVVFATPEAVANGRELYVTRTDSPSSAYFFDRWRATSAGRASQTEPQ